MRKEHLPILGQIKIFELLLILLVSVHFHVLINATVLFELIVQSVFENVLDNFSKFLQINHKAYLILLTSHKTRTSHCFGELISFRINFMKSASNICTSLSAFKRSVYLMHMKTI